MGSDAQEDRCQKKHKNKVLVPDLSLQRLHQRKLVSIWDNVHLYKKAKISVISLFRFFKTLKLRLWNCVYRSWIFHRNHDTICKVWILIFTYNPSSSLNWRFIPIRRHTLDNKWGGFDWAYRIYSLQAGLWLLYDRLLGQCLR